MLKKRRLQMDVNSRNGVTLVVAPPPQKATVFFKSVAYPDFLCQDRVGGYKEMVWNQGFGIEEAN
jgi:hypothetical protein